MFEGTWNPSSLRPTIESFPVPTPQIAIGRNGPWSKVGLYDQGLLQADPPPLSGVVPVPITKYPARSESC